jgi:hypothetical protein
MRREECFRDGLEGATVFGPAEAVAFITIVDIGHGDAVLLHCGDDLLGLRGFDTHVVTFLQRAPGRLERQYAFSAEQSYARI